MRHNQYLLILLLLLMVALPIAAQGSTDSLQNIGETRISLMNPFTGAPITVTLLRLLYVVGGLVLLVAGWSAYRVALGVAGFVVGASFGASLTANAAPALALVVTLLFGVIGSMLASFVYLLAVALVGGYIGLILTGSVMNMVGVVAEDITLLVIYGAGVLGGAVLALALAVELTIILTSGLGAVMLAGGLGLLNTRFGVLWVLLLFVAGVIVQMGVARSRGGKPFERRLGG